MFADLRYEAINGRPYLTDNGVVGARRRNTERRRVLYDDGGTHDGALAVSAEDCAVDGARQLKVGEPYK